MITKKIVIKKIVVCRNTTLTQDNKVVLQQCERLFHEAIRRRAKYDAQKKESDRVLSLEQLRLQKEHDNGATAIKPKAFNNTGATSSNTNSNSTYSEEVVNLDEIDMEDLVGGSIATVVAPLKVSSTLVDEEIHSETASAETPLPMQPTSAVTAAQSDTANVVGTKRPRPEEPIQTGMSTYIQYV